MQLAYVRYQATGEILLRDEKLQPLVSKDVLAGSHDHPGRAMPIIRCSMCASPALPTR